MRHWGLDVKDITNFDFESFKAAIKRVMRTVLRETVLA
jgi:hypothetical protein